MHPASVEDKRLLVAVVAFLNVYFREEGAVAASAAEDADLRWMLELLLNQVRPVAANLAKGDEYCGAPGPVAPAQFHTVNRSRNKSHSKRWQSQNQVSLLRPAAVDYFITDLEPYRSPKRKKTTWCFSKESCF